MMGMVEFEGLTEESVRTAVLDSDAVRRSPTRMKDALKVRVRQE